MTLTKVIDKSEIANLIPHAGSMCLIDKVEHWDKETLLCSSRTHLQMDNPLIKGNTLSAVHAIEYCAQAMAIHGGLLAQENNTDMPSGYLAAIRNVELHYTQLSDIQHDLLITVKQLLAQGGSLIYEFRMYYSDGSNEFDIATGRTTVIQMPT